MPVHNAKAIFITKEEWNLLSEIQEKERCLGKRQTILRLIYLYEQANKTQLTGITNEKSERQRPDLNRESQRD
jgi:hypothetical protein